MGWLTQFFNLSKGERYGFWLLVALIVIGLTLPYFIEKKTKPAYEVNKEAYERQIKQFMATPENSEHQTPKGSKGSPSQEEISYFHFNPNDVAFDSLLKLGVSEKLAHTIINYRQAGGRFHKKKDLNAIYGMPDSTFKRLKPCVVIPKERGDKHYYSEANKKALDSTIDTDESDSSISKSDQKNLSANKSPVPLNKADSATLTQVTGIGDFFAGEIVSRRDKLGGYTDIRQLLGIYNFDSSSLKQVKSQLSLDPSRVRKLSISNSSFEAFLDHPFLDYPQVKAIFNYKDQVDSITSVKELKSERILGRKNFKKVKPYLKP